jgi:hypothetical protein
MTTIKGPETAEYARIHAILAQLPEHEQEIIAQQAADLRAIINGRGHDLSHDGALLILERVGRVLAGERK